MTKIRLKIDFAEILNEAYIPFLDDQTAMQIFFGGSSSGKSVFLAQRIVYDLLKGGRNYLCCRAVGKTLKTSIFNEIMKVVYEWELSDFFTSNRTDMTITCANGFQAILKGLDDVEKIKSITPSQGILTDIFIEEATEAQLEDYKQLTKRLRGKSAVGKRITLSFNPVFFGHWIHRQFFGGWVEGENLFRSHDLLIFKTTYKDNRFLTEMDCRNLEAEGDKFFRDVYTLGNWGVLGDLILTNWEIADLDEKSKLFDIMHNGLDFGYSNDPTVLIRCWYNKHDLEIYVWQEYVNKKVTNYQIAHDIKELVGGESIVCDSSEPKSISELCGYGISAVAARKGPGSVIHGLQWLQKHRIIIDKRCIHTINQLKQYHWTRDKGGRSINKPAGRDDCIDALRYALEFEMLEYGDDDVFDVGRVAYMSISDW